VLFVHPETSQGCEAAFIDFADANGPDLICSTLERHGINLSETENEERHLSSLLRVAVREGLQTLAHQWAESSLQPSSVSNDNFYGTSDPAHGQASFIGSSASSNTLVEHRQSRDQTFPATSLFGQLVYPPRREKPNTDGVVDPALWLFPHTAGPEEKIQGPENNPDFGNVGLRIPESCDNNFILSDVEGRLDTEFADVTFLERWPEDVDTMFQK